MDLLKDNLKKLYFKFLIPSLGSAMVMSIYTLTDAIVIGKGVGAFYNLFFPDYGCYYPFMADLCHLHA